MGSSRSSALLAAGLVVYLLVLPAMAAVFMLAAVLLGGDTNCPSDGGQQQVGDRTITAEQATNARIITDTTQHRGLPRAAAVVAVAVAGVESHLDNVNHGDRDSLGLFQQRPSQGWGSPTEITNPSAATSAFLDRLVTKPNWYARASADPATFGALAQAVQGSARPERYAPWQATATDLVTHSWSGPDVPAPPSALPGGAVPAQAAAATAPRRCPDTGQAGLPSGAPAPQPGRDQPLPAGFALPDDPRQRTVVTTALAQRGKPYKYGAKGPEAFDCSGLVQNAWSAAGVPLPAGTTTQVTTGSPVPGLDALQPGDLLFIPGAGGSPAQPRHVGLYIGQGMLVDAYDEHTGVVTDQLPRWSGQIVAIRRPGGAPPSTT